MSVIAISNVALWSGVFIRVEYEFEFCRRDVRVHVEFGVEFQ